jgi:putative transposase
MRENGLRALHGYRTRRWVSGKPAVLIPSRLKRQFTVKRATRGTLIHQGQGVLYGSDAWRRFCRTNRMSRKGNCWDNTVAESFFSSLKKERIKKHIYPSREPALADIATNIEDFYNRRRPHRHLGGISP